MNRLIKDIPSDWKAIRFDKVFDLLPTLTLSRNDLTTDESFDGIYNIHYGDIHSTYKFVILDFDKEKSIPKIINKEINEARLSLLITGDIVIADASEDYEGVAACIELSNIKDRKVTAGLHTFVARDKKGITSVGFRSYLLKHPWVSNELKKMATGSKVFGVSKTNIAKLEVVLPPLPEQQKIAAILSKWDELIEMQTQLITAKEKLKTSLMQKLLSSEVRFPGFEDEWEEYTLGEIAEFSNGKAHENIVDENGQYKLITSKFISTDGKEFRRLNDRLTPLFKNDIVMVMSDVPNGKAIGKCYLVEKNDIYSLNQRIGRFKFENHNPVFMYYILNRNSHFLAFDSGVGQTNLRKDDILECPLFIPSYNEQEKIAKTISACDEELQSLKDELEAIKLQKKGLMQQLLTGKIRVKV